jgi:hypothetical protein
LERKGKSEYFKIIGLSRIVKKSENFIFQDNPHMVNQQLLEIG